MLEPDWSYDMSVANLNARKSSGIAQIRTSNSWGWGELV